MSFGWVSFRGQAASFRAANANATNRYFRAQAGSAITEKGIRAGSAAANSFASAAINNTESANILAARAGVARTNQAAAAKAAALSKPSDISDQVSFSGSLAGFVDFSANSASAGKFQFLTNQTLLNNAFDAAMQAFTSDAAVIDAINSAVQGLTSQGEAIDTVSVLGNTFTASTSGASAHDVFTLTWNQSSGTWSSASINPIDQEPYDSDLSSLVQEILAAQGLTSQGAAIDTVSVTGNTLTASTSDADAHPVFTLTLNQSSETWTFKLINPIDHLPKTLDLTKLAQEIITDTETSTLSNSALSADIKIALSNNDQATISGALSDTTNAGMLAIPASSAFQFVSGSKLKNAFKLAMTAVTSHGEAIDTVSVVGNTLTASTSGPEAHPVFTITLHKDSGLWTFKLLNPIDGKPHETTKFVTSLNLSGLMQGVKSTGETMALPSNIIVNIYGDQGSASGKANQGSVHQGNLAYTSPTASAPAAPAPYTPPYNYLTGHGYAATTPSSQAAGVTLSLFI